MEAEALDQGAGYSLLPPPPPPPPPALGTWPGQEGHEGAAEYEDGEYEDGEYEEGQEYEEEYEEEYVETEEGRPAEASTSEGGRVLIVQRPQALVAGSGPTTPPPDRYDQQPLPPNFKTVLCRHWLGGHCSHGSRCTYAHGEHELRRSERLSAPRPPNGRERTALCRFWQQGYCRHGNSCTFLHGQPGAGQLERRQGAQRGPRPPPRAQQAPPPRAADSREESSQELLAVDPRELASLLQGTHLGPPGAPPPAQPANYAAAAAGTPLPSALPPGSYAAAAAPPPTGGGAPPAGPPPVALSPEVRGVLQRRFCSLLCPITRQPFDDPVVAADGNIYERRAIEEWLYRAGNDTSPLTHDRLPHKMLMACGTMRRCVEEVAGFVAAMRQQVL